MLFPRSCCRTKGFHFQGVNKWHGKWSKVHHVNATCKGFAEHVNHVKHLVGWTIMACHVYDLGYYKVMTIANCDMQFEDTKVQ